MRPAQQHVAALDAPKDLGEMASPDPADSNAAISVLDDPDASEILDVLMAAIRAATEE
ncbi:MAG TPA: hypothetical protein VNR51_01025 [Hyphomicrobium sp.]|nr:hypothetical protein [Hyphomicrobium sp.]